MKQILLVEDEQHKKDELASYLNDFIGEQYTLDVADSVRAAVVSVADNDYDLIILDMALPTFTTDEDNIDGGRDQALGGVEVLRSLKSLNKRANVIIVTQYPDVTVDGKRVKLSLARVQLARKYQQNISGALLYKYKSNLNGSKIKKILDHAW